MTTDSHQQHLANEEHGRKLREVFTGPMLDTTVEIGPQTNQPDWSSLEHANDVMYRAICAANAAGLAGHAISSVSMTGCTQYGNLTVGWNYKPDGEPEVAA